MAVIMCVLTMTKKRKKDVQEWLEQNPYEPTTQEVEVEAEKTYIYSFDKKMNNILSQKKIKKVKNNLYSLLASL